MPPILQLGKLSLEIIFAIWACAAAFSPVVYEGRVSDSSEPVSIKTWNPAQSILFFSSVLLGVEALVTVAHIASSTSESSEEQTVIPPEIAAYQPPQFLPIAPVVPVTPVAASHPALALPKVASVSSEGGSFTEDDLIAAILGSDQSSSKDEFNDLWGQENE